jgi:transposase InsO family protein
MYGVPTDVWGPSPHLSHNGNRYYVCFIDDYSKFIWLFPFCAKSDVFNIFLKFQAFVERYFERKIKSIQSDWGGEYRNLNKFFTSLGISHRLSCPHTHQQNGSVERKHRHINKMQHEEEPWPPCTPPWKTTNNRD